MAVMSSLAVVVARALRTLLEFLSLRISSGASIAALASETARTFLSNWTGYDAPGGGWRILAVLIAVVNLKNLPGVWHLRFFGTIFYQLHLQPTVIPPTALFQPLLTSSRTSLHETDYNIHKSNSTYFSDMDISRTHLFTAVMRKAIQKVKARGGTSIQPLGATSGTHHSHAKGRDIIALGGVTCLFKKEILPYQKFEMWSRILTWDNKWFYLLTHLVKPGVAKPKGWTLQPWRTSSKGAQEESVDPEKLKGAIFATALAKYVVKKGRMTVAPEQALVDAEMVPVKGEGWVYKGMADVDANGEIVADADDAAAHVGVNGDSAEEKEKEQEWNWDIIETERLKGLKYAEAFLALDGLHDCFDGGEKGALGEYADIFF